MLRFIIRILGNVVALYVASIIVPGFVVSGSWEQYLIAGLVFGLLNLLVRPILKVISFPLILLTLGMFTAIINILMLWILDYLVSFITIEGFLALVGATIIVSVVNLFFSMIAKVA
ncbi:MAG: phage holin family protein [bacterium]|nr:phage holin family protein [bacterium]